MWNQIDPNKIKVSHSNKELKERIQFLHNEIEKLTYHIYQYSIELKRCNQCYPRD